MADNPIPTGPSTQAVRHDVPYTTVHRAVRRVLESTQDVIAALLALGLFAVMVRVLWILAAQALAPTLSFRDVIAEALFILVLIELQRLLILYLRDHHVSVDVMVEIALVAALREVSLFGIVEMAALQLLSVTGFVLALGVLLRFGDLRAPRRRVHAHGAKDFRRPQPPAT
jgi:uncharacterized membrane protein (DUF373 family)